MTEELTKRVDTASGTLFRPQKSVTQFVCLFAVFVGGPGLGWIIAQSLGGVSETGRIALCIPFVAILFLGYGLWSARLKAIAFKHLGFGLLRVIAMMLIRREKPENLESVLPTKDSLEKMAVQAQQASSSFIVVSVPVSAVSALLALGLTSETGAAYQFLFVGGSCIAWGWFLSRLARRGYLPVMEEGG